MTLQVETTTVSSAPGPLPRRWSWAALTVVLAVAVAVTATALSVGFVAGRSHGSLPARPPAAVLGRSLVPLAVYRVAAGADPSHLQKGQEVVPQIGRAARSTVLQRNPVINLHVTYARVRPVVGHWQIEFVAPEGASFNVHSTQGRFFDVVIDGKALPLVFIVGSQDGTNFGIGAGADWLDQAPAVAFARTLTTSVSVANCSQSAVESNECG